MSKRLLWYPLSKVDQDRPTITSAEHIYLYDDRGHRYIDANSGLWNVSLGYNNKCIEKATIDQLRKVSYVNSCEFTNEQAEKLSELLVDINHEDIDKVFLTCTGSESVELAIKLVRRYSYLKYDEERNLIAVIKNSYHGNFYGSMSCSSYERKTAERYGPLLNGFVELSLPFCRCCKSNELSKKCENKILDTLESELDKVKDRLAGIFIEPILGSAGVIPLPKSFLKYIENFTKQNDILLVFDEVATGFGRTGSMFYYQQVNIKPDIVLMSKGINNGTLPLGAVAVSTKITEQFYNEGEELFHLSTQNGNAICCASAIATIKLLCDNNFDMIKQVNVKGEMFQSLLEEKINDSKNVFDIRRKGLMIAIDYVDDTGNQISQEKLWQRVQMLRKQNILTEWSFVQGVTSSVVMFLPFVITEDELLRVANIIASISYL